MASNAGLVATEAPPSTLPPPVTSSISTEDVLNRVPKRPREPDSSPPRTAGVNPTNPLSSPTKSARLALASVQAAPAPLTGAAALEDERRRRQEEQSTSPATSDNPSHRVLASLMSGASQAMSRPADAPSQPAPTAAMDPAAIKAATALSITPMTNATADENGETSPQSATSTAGPHVTASPTPMDVDNKLEVPGSQQVAGQENRPQPGSLSYPGSLQSTGSMAETPNRNMSFPMPSSGQSPPGSSGKKHKCPFCATEFTRHHNLKSHLLTHSQEKPYVCTDPSGCSMRFRRLHDLKRHGKLHSGEKNHICPKCDRKFARGDALARHSKGPGGCAGRRSSMGSFADGDDLDGDESAMSGMAYDGDEDSIARQASGAEYGAHSRTYPPTGGRPGGLYPPNVVQGASNSTSPSGPGSMYSQTPNTSTSSGGAGAGGVFSHAGMTESPKPLSPGMAASDARQRSPSLNQQMQQQQFGRRPSELQAARPKMAGRGAGTAAPNDSNMFAQSDPSVWAYIQTLEDKVKFLTDKFTSMEQELADLKRKQADPADGAGMAAIPTTTV